jgi:hypothetical protein
MTSLISDYAKSPLTRYVIGVLVAWALFFAVGYWLRGPTPGHPVLHVFYGFLLGMLSMYIAMRIYRAGPHDADTAAHS